MKDQQDVTELFTCLLNRTELADLLPLGLQVKFASIRACKGNRKCRGVSVLLLLLSHNVAFQKPHVDPPGAYLQVQIEKDEQVCT